MQKFSYHTHTNFSDGKNSIEEMITQAEKQGLEELGISDHLIVHKNFKQCPSWKDLSTINASHIYNDCFKKTTEAFKKHADNVRKIAKKHSIKVFVGAEVDYFTYDGWEDEFKQLKKDVDCDYFITGNHFYETSDELPVHPIYTGKYYACHKNQTDLIKRHFKTLAKAAQSGLFEFIAHVDYMRKTPHYNNKIFDQDKIALIKICKQCNATLEVNTKHVPANEETSPNLWWLKEMKKFNLPILLSDDAHNKSSLTQGFDVAEKLLADMNYTNRWDMSKKRKS